MNLTARTKNILSIATIVLMLALAFILCAVVSGIGMTEGNASTTLRSHKVIVGAAVDVPTLFNEPVYAQTVAEQFNMVEPEAAMKWPVIHPAPGVYDFHDGDTLVQFAEKNGMLVRGHCLWGGWLPTWTNAPEVKRNFRAVVKEHIQTVVRHYRSRVFAWDVVNEAFSADGTLKGKGFEEDSFIWAHQADPSAKLFYNDYDIEEINAKSDAVYAMVKDFKRRGVPIDGVGFQTHLNIIKGLNVSSFKQNLARFVALGVEIHITELDVAIPKSAWFGEKRQARIYESVVKACLEESRCTAIQTWGFTDKHSWIPWITRGIAGDALLFDANYKPKPAYKSFLHGLSYTHS